MLFFLLFLQELKLTPCVVISTSLSYFFLKIGTFSPLDFQSNILDHKIAHLLA